MPMRPLTNTRSRMKALRRCRRRRPIIVRHSPCFPTTKIMPYILPKGRRRRREGEGRKEGRKVGRETQCNWGHTLRTTTTTTAKRAKYNSCKETNTRGSAAVLFSALVRSWGDARERSRNLRRIPAVHHDNCVGGERGW